MSHRFTDYHEAYDAARALSDQTQHDVAIRGVKEYGRPGFNVILACTNDSDYARAEIITSGSPRVA